MNSFETASLKSLRLLDVNSNIDVFANQWVEENGLSDLQDYLSMLDRLNVPYRIVGSDAALAQYEFKVSVHVSETGLAAIHTKKQWKQPLQSVNILSFWKTLHQINRIQLAWQSPRCISRYYS